MPKCEVALNCEGLAVARTDVSRQISTPPQRCVINQSARKFGLSICTFRYRPAAFEAECVTSSASATASIEHEPLARGTIAAQARIRQRLPRLVPCRDVRLFGRDIFDFIHLRMRRRTEIDREASRSQKSGSLEASTGTDRAMFRYPTSLNVRCTTARTAPLVKQALYFLNALHAGGTFPVQRHAFRLVDEAIQDDLCPRRVVANGKVKLPLRPGTASPKAVLAAYAPVCGRKSPGWRIGNKLHDMCRKAMPRKEATICERAEQKLVTEPLELKAHSGPRGISHALVPSKLTQAFPIRQKLLFN